MEKRGMTRMNDSKLDLKPITVNCRNRYFMHSWILINPGFLLFVFSLNTKRNVQPSNTCWVLFCLLPARRIALTRWLAPKKRIQIKPLEPCSTGLSRWQRTKWQALHGKVTPCQHCHLLSFIYLYIHRFIQWKAEDAQIINCVARCRHDMQPCILPPFYKH